MPGEPGRPRSCCRTHRAIREGYANDDVAYAPDGKRVYAAYTDGGSNSTVLVSSSTDDGATWATPVVAIEDPYGDYGYLSPSIARPLREADAKWVYLSVQSKNEDPGINISFSRSDDRGLNWSPERGIAGGDLLRSSQRRQGGRRPRRRSSDHLFRIGVGSGAGHLGARSADHGTNFDGPAAVAIAYAGDPDVKIGNLGVAHVAFAKQSGNFYNMAYA